MNSHQITVKWICERNDIDFEDAMRGRCGHEFETTEDIYEWEFKSCYAICPHCKANLTQVNDVAVIIKNNKEPIVVNDIENIQEGPKSTGIFNGFGHASEV